MATTYTVIGYYADDDSIQITGVIEGDHEVAGGDDEYCQPWATVVEATDVYTAEALARADMEAENDQEDDQP